jgi:hypothetical protein
LIQTLGRDLGKLVFIRITGEVKAIDDKFGFMNIEDERGAYYTIKVEANQVAGILLGDRVEVEVEWARGKASSIKSIGKS